MKRILLFLFLSLNFTFAQNPFQTQNSLSGGGIFDSKGCTMCHDVSMEKMGPSLQFISTVYMGDEDTLVSYLKGEREPIVRPQNASIMKPQLLKIRTLYEDEVRALARYILETN